LLILIGAGHICPAPTARGIYPDGQLGKNLVRRIHIYLARLLYVLTATLLAKDVWTPVFGYQGAWTATRRLLTVFGQVFWRWRC
jgi:hypothetical protein